MDASAVVAEGYELADLLRRWEALPARDVLHLSDAEVDRLRAAEWSLRQRGRWVAGPTTLLEVLRLDGDEVRNCRVVRWLLDPLAPHGYGTDALSAVLTIIRERSAVSGASPPDFPFPERASLMVEEARGDARADIVVNGPGWQVVIEAKIFASEGDRQGARLAELWPGATYVFLTRDGKAMRSGGDEEWVPLSWGDLLAAVRSVVARSSNKVHGSESVRRARSAAHDYLYGVRRLG